jgi:glycerol-3-phosphate cytidylyltransferase
LTTSDYRGRPGDDSGRSDDDNFTNINTSGVKGYVPGVFDMFHIGHLNVLLESRERCDHLIVGVVTDDRVQVVKGRLPLVPLVERMEIVAALDIVDEVVVDDSSDKVQMWERLHFDVVFKGDDWKGTPKGDRLEEGMARVGARVHYLPYTQHTSSSRLRNLITGEFAEPDSERP